MGVCQTSTPNPCLTIGGQRRSWIRAIKALAILGSTSADLTLFMIPVLEKTDCGHNGHKIKKEGERL
jgi:hypothetical protein